MSPALTLPLDDDVARFVAQQTAFRQSVEANYGPASTNGDLIAHAVNGSLKLVDAVRLAAAIQHRRPDSILEIGSFLGFSTRVLLDASADIGSRVVSVDPRVRHRIFDDILDHVLSFNPDERLECVDGWFSAPDLSGPVHDYTNYEPKMSADDARAHLLSIPVIDEPFDHFDFFFIDGDHSYGSTVRNLVLCLRMANPGAVVVIHDALTWRGVEAAARAVTAELDGVELVGVSGAAERELFRSVWSRFKSVGADNPALGALTGSISDGLCFVQVAADVDVDALAAGCAGLDDDFIARTGGGGDAHKQKPVAAKPASAPTPASSPDAAAPAGAERPEESTVARLDREARRIIKGGLRRASRLADEKL